jgi:transposase
MDRELVSDKLWEIIEPFLPPEPSKDKGGRPRIPARAVLCGIIYVLKSGIPWRRLPKQLGYGSGVTCWRRLRDWQKAGVFVLLFRNLLDRLGRCGVIDWSRACVDSATVPAKKGARRSGLILPIVASRAPNATC